MQELSEWKFNQRFLQKWFQAMDYLLLLISAATMYFGEKFKDYTPLHLPRYILEGIPGKHWTSEQAGKKKIFWNPLRLCNANMQNRVEDLKVTGVTF